MYEQGYKKFIYLCPVYDKCFSSPTIPDKLELVAKQNILTIQMKNVKQNKKYRIEEAIINKTIKSKF